MTGFFVWVIYVGGVFAMPDRKLGFWRRVCWLSEIGEWLAERVMK